MSVAAQVPRFDRLPPGHRTELPDPRRTDPERLAREVQLASRGPIVTALLEAADTLLVILNERRQLVAWSQTAAALVGEDALLGRRLGEALGCVNAQTPAGCGTVAACATCGALGAIVTAQRTRRPTEAECLLRTVSRGAEEFGVRAALTTVEGVELTAVSLRDLSAQKRREALEHVFFHDVLNTVTGLRGWATLLARPGTDARRATERVDALSRRLEREITWHRDLLLAESGKLTVHLAPVACSELLEDLEDVFASHAAARERSIVASADPPDLGLSTDVPLLLRVLGNMVRNACEAVAPGGTVRIRAERDPAAPAERLRFTVHNAGEIPPDVQQRIFVRSFSTKGGRGRGLGTYGMKLLGERHLGGEVSFTSSAEAGTTFSIRLPVAGPGA